MRALSTIKGADDSMGICADLPSYSQEAVSEHICF